MSKGREYITTPPGWTFDYGDRVRKTKGSSWQGRVVGFYSTELTPEGYGVESEREPGSVQIYPAAALELVKP
jgi:dihydrofolate reductase (trimethoprim resistance protein)